MFVCITVNYVPLELDSEILWADGTLAISAFFFLLTLQNLEDTSGNLFVTGFCTSSDCARISQTHKAWLLVNIYARFVV